jgi:hypothetical protein
VLFTGNIQGKGVADDQSETFVIDQQRLAATPGQPMGGFSGPVAIEEITLSSLDESATIAQLGSIRLDQSFYLVGVQATVGDDDNDDDDDDQNS